MKKIFSYLKNYFSTLKSSVLFSCTVFTAILIFVNYYFGLNAYINQMQDLAVYGGWYIVFLIAFAGGYFINAAFKNGKYFRNISFLFLLLVAPAIFSWKMVYLPQLIFSSSAAENEYWNAIVYWPIKIVGVVLMLSVLHLFYNSKEPFYGLKVRDQNFGPYYLMLLMMVPLVAAAATQQDFLSMYPKFQNVAFLHEENTGWYKLLYELSYGSDFFTIELFFRGFLVLAFAKFAGKDVILPMAMFYCTIHFGKPLGECISSYFGGIILGVVVYHTRSIFGGLLVHVGIAWLMELAGWLAKGWQ